MKKLKAYICTTDYHHDFDQANVDLPHFYTSLSRLKKDRTCWKYCGVLQVEVKVKLLRTVKKAKGELA